MSLLDVGTSPERPCLTTATLRLPASQRKQWRLQPQARALISLVMASFSVSILFGFAMESVAGE